MSNWRVYGVSLIIVIHSLCVWIRDGFAVCSRRNAADRHAFPACVFRTRSVWLAVCVSLCADQGETHEVPYTNRVCLFLNIVTCINDRNLFQENSSSKTRFRYCMKLKWV